MADVVGKPRVELHLMFKLGEEEVRALEALADYGDDAFIQVFYEKLGKHYMVNHETGLRSFLKSCRSDLPKWLGRADNARKAFEE